MCYISPYTLPMTYPQKRINSEGKEHGPMRKYLATFFVLMLAATIGLSACAKKEEAPPPPPPPPAAAPMAPADNMAPAAPAAPAAEPAKK